MKLESGLKDFIEFPMITLKQSQKTTKCSDHHIINLTAHTAKIVVWILRSRIKRQIEDAHGVQFGF
jgi:hypothetical protein